MKRRENKPRKRSTIPRLTTEEKQVLERIRQAGKEWKATDKKEFTLAGKALKKLVKRALAGDIDASALVLELQFGPPGEFTQ
jgi:hypothetical protein